MTTIGILLMAYGSPEHPEDIEPYLRHIRGGRQPSQEAVEELRNRYETIGWSPLNKITRMQAEKLAKSFDIPIKVYVGMKHWHPFIEEAIHQAAKDNIKKLIGLVMAPHYSKLSIEQYMERAKQEASKYNIDLLRIDSWHLNNEYLKIQAQLVNDAFSELKQRVNDILIVFSAHSLPERILKWDDPYPKQLEETAHAIVDRLRITAPWVVAYQSASATGEKWLGPDILDVITQAKKEGKEAVLICPIGFVADHLEVLYDIDVEAKQKGKELGIIVERPESLNYKEEFIRALKNIVMQRLKMEGKSVLNI